MSNTSVSQSAEIAGQEAAHEVERAVENAAADLQAELDAANDRAENAEIVAEQIAEAAIEGERGERIAELQRGIEECRMRQDESRDALRGLVTQMQSMQETLSTILTSAASTPTQSQEPTQEVTEIPITAEAAEILEATNADPLQAEVSEDAPPEVEVAVRKRRTWM